MRLLLLLWIVRTWAFEWPWDHSSSAVPTSHLSSAHSTPVTSATAPSSSLDGEGYAPTQTLCPTGSILRNASGIGSGEKAYLEKRQALVNDNLVDFFEQTARLSNFDAGSFVNRSKETRNISIGLSFSGGGYRAMLAGAGQLLALDSRYEDLNDRGMGGLLQSSNYITGLSGLSWLLGTLILNDWMSVADVVKPDSGIWNLDDLIFNPSGINVFKTAEYYGELSNALDAKQDAGYSISITDVWGRALSYQFFKPDANYNGGENRTWSGIRHLDSFKNVLMPYPILVANGRSDGTAIVNQNSTVFEFTPYEMGSWDPSLASFADLRFLGNNVSDGRPNGTCYTNFDNAGFVMGTSSSLFNQVLLRVNGTNLNWAIKKILNIILTPISKKEIDIATYEPNPFYKNSYGESQSIAEANTLDLVDGGEDQQNIAVYPLIQNARQVDVIFAFDNSADTPTNWPNGTSLAHTFDRQFSDQGRGTAFPFVPTVKEVLDDKLNEKPLFFGCDARNLTELVDYHGQVNATDVPLIVYVPNLMYLYASNTSTYKMSYDRDEMMLLIENGFETSSRGNYSADRQWPTCVGCAIIRRQQERWGEEQSDECKKCFQQYCWTGGMKQTDELTLALKASSSSSKSSSKLSSQLSSSLSSLTSKAPRAADAGSGSGTTVASGTSVSSLGLGSTLSKSQDGAGRRTAPVAALLAALALLN